MVLAINIAVKYSIMTPDGPRNAIAIVADTEQTVFSGGYSEQVLKEKWFIKRYEQLIELNGLNKFYFNNCILIV